MKYRQRYYSTTLAAPLLLLQKCWYLFKMSTKIVLSWWVFWTGAVVERQVQQREDSLNPLKEVEGQLEKATAQAHGLFNMQKPKGTKYVSGKPEESRTGCSFECLRGSGNNYWIFRLAGLVVMDFGPNWKLRIPQSPGRVVIECIQFFLEVTEILYNFL